MKNILFKSLTILALGAGMLASCTRDLNTSPVNAITSATVYADFANYKPILAKIYAGYAVSGQEGPAGKPDIAGIDEGFSSYIRQYFKAQELTTDEAVIGWNDGTIKDYHWMKWTSTNEFVAAMYNRIFYQIVLCNEFIRETQDDKLAARSITGANADLAKMYRDEARFCRALSYWHALDMFGNVPFVTENDKVGATLPKQTDRATLFAYIEGELLAIENTLKDPKTNEYGRADKAAAWMLLANLYLNAEVYTGSAKNTEAATYAKKVMDITGYSLESKYANLFLADNHKSNEIIFAVNFDGNNTRTYGGTTFLVHAAVGGSMSAAAYGVDGGWGGLRTTAGLVDKFTDTADKRGIFHTAGQTKAIADIGEFTNGYAVGKYKNVTSTGATGSNLTFVDTDFPIFRLAEAYLIYAEAIKRGGTGDATLALNKLVALRSRAGITANLASYDLNYIIDERARELYWEGHRRTDLIRFGLFTSGTYLWPWKGNTINGQAVESWRALFPIPSADINANPNLVQNTGY